MIKDKKGRHVKIACFQMSVLKGDEALNTERALRAIDEISLTNPDILCFPELFTTGFDYDYLSSRPSSLTWEILDRFSEKARALDAYIVAGSMPEREEDRVFNTLFVIAPDGERVAFYRKIHLFPLMGEDKYFTPGEDVLCLQTPIAKIGAALCYDIRFPGLFQRMALEGAQIVFVPAQFPVSRIEHWDALLKARAIENQLFVVGVNRVGEDTGGRFPGHTAIFDPMGIRIAAGEEGEGWIEVSVDLDMIGETRKRLPALFYQGFRDEVPDRDRLI